MVQILSLIKIEYPIVQIEINLRIIWKTVERYERGFIGSNSRGVRPDIIKFCWGLGYYANINNWVLKSIGPVCNLSFAPLCCCMSLLSIIF